MKIAQCMTQLAPEGHECARCGPSIIAIQLTTILLHVVFACFDYNLFAINVSSFFLNVLHYAKLIMDTIN